MDINALIKELEKMRDGLDHYLTPGDPNSKLLVYVQSEDGTRSKIVGIEHDTPSAFEALVILVLG